MIDHHYETAVDRKSRWGGILEHPRLSTWQRNCLDGGRVEGLCRALKPYDYESLLDVGCGGGEGQSAKKGFYCGIDNSFLRVHFASAEYPGSFFVNGDARRLPFQNQAFDMVMLIDTSHHITDEQLPAVVWELKRVSKKYIVISDPVVFSNQSRLSHLIYSLDRGGCFRKVDHMKDILKRVEGVRLLDVVEFKTFPGLYLHAAFILQITN